VDGLTPSVASSMLTIVPVNNQEPVATSSLCLCLLVKDLDPFDSNLPVGPAFVLVAQTV
jgi:hypothetical protein